MIAWISLYAPIEQYFDVSRQRHAMKAVASAVGPLEGLDSRQHAVNGIGTVLLCKPISLTIT